MWYIVAAVALLATSGVFGFSRLRNPDAEKSQIANRIFDRITFKSLSTDQINIYLARLEMEEPPEHVMGAMCYEAMVHQAVAEYVCPVCGEKTIYNDFQTVFIEWELQGCRRMVESINEYTEFDVSLDETLFCDFCSDSQDEEPALMLRVTSTDSTETVNRISILDLRMLEAFLQGDLYYTTFNDGHEPLQEHAERIRELLGVFDN
ncbi:MAG: hypothetical protein K8S24_06495 [Candidatus Aegiribacteria sp.]|nr:hypothetical protein [Candidatus Aegiribacteria sp.]